MENEQMKKISLYRKYRMLNVFATDESQLETSVIDEKSFCCICTASSFSVYSLQDLSLMFFHNIHHPEQPGVDLLPSSVTVKKQLFVHHLVYLWLSNNTIQIYTRDCRIKTLVFSDQKKTIIGISQLRDGRVLVLCSGNSLCFIRETDILQWVEVTDDQKSVSGEISGASFLVNNDSKILLHDCVNGHVFLYCLDTNKIIFHFTQKAEKLFVTDVADIVVFQYEKQLHVVNVRKDRVVKVLSDVLPVDSTNYKRVSIMGNFGLFLDNNGVVTVYDLEFAKSLNTLYSVTDAIFINSDIFVTVSRSSLRVYVLDNGNFVLYKMRNSIVLPKIIKSQGNLLIGASEYTVMIANVYKDEQTKLIKVNDEIINLFVSSNAALILCKNGLLYILDLFSFTFSHDDFSASENSLNPVSVVKNASLSFFLSIEDNANTSCTSLGIFRNFIFMANENSEVFLIHRLSKRVITTYSFEFQVLALDLTDDLLVAMLRGPDSYLVEIYRRNTDLYSIKTEDKFKHIKFKSINLNIHSSLASARCSVKIVDDNVILAQINNSLVVLDIYENSSNQISTHHCINYFYYQRYVAIIRDKEIEIVDVLTGSVLDTVNVEEQISGGAFMDKMKFMVLVTENTGDLWLYYNRHSFDFSSSNSPSPRPSPLNFIKDENAGDRGEKMKKTADRISEMNRQLFHDDPSAMENIKTMDKDQVRKLIDDLVLVSCIEDTNCIVNRLLLHKSKLIDEDQISTLFRIYSENIVHYENNLIKGIKYMN